jgi:hypothetical protein
MTKSEYPRALTLSIARFLQSTLTAGPLPGLRPLPRTLTAPQAASDFHLLELRQQHVDDQKRDNVHAAGHDEQGPVPLVRQASQ